MNRSYRLAAKLFHALPLPAGKLAQSRLGRLGAEQRWVEWAGRSTGEGPLLWFHATSVGEAQVNEPIAHRLRAKCPRIRAIQTYSSPSAEAWQHSTLFQRADYVPPELPRAVASVFQALRPAVLVVSRGDLWPELVCSAFDHGVPVAVVGGAIRPTSARLRWPIKHVFESMYSRLGFVGAVSPGDARSWTRLGVPPDVVCVTGDPRDDHVLERPLRYSSIMPLIPWAGAGHTLVGGSTHSRDEHCLMAALSRVGRTWPDARLIIVPHDASRDSESRLISLAQSFGIPALRWNGTPPDHDIRVVVITEPGVLADVYLLGSVAYVGGGFGKAGVHSLAEPAAFALATLAGPVACRDEAAKRFLRSGGVVAIEGTKPADSLAEHWMGWLRDDDARTSAGIAARNELQQGSATQTVEALAPLLERAGVG